MAAVGAVGGGAALALARRLRGLFWAGLGLAIYPRARARRRRRRTATPRPAAPQPPPTLLYLPYDDAVSVPPSTRLAGLPLAERVLRPALRAGYTRRDRAGCLETAHGAGPPRGRRRCGRR